MASPGASPSRLDRRTVASIAFLLLTALLGCAGEPPRDLLLRDVRIVDLETGEISSASTDPDRLATALALYEMYAETYSGYHSAHYMLALARRATGDTAGARASLERALEIHPEYVNAREKLAELEDPSP